jgi:type 1 glutamine amidotransferase
MTNKSVRAHLIAGGQYHDIDYARLILLQMLGDHPEVRTTVAAGYGSSAEIERSDFLVTYTCNIAPDDEQVARLRRFLERGGRWLALHGTNSILAQNEAGRWYAPEDKSGVIALLGSQFAAHPPIAPYTVTAAAPRDPLVDGIGDFIVEGGDELYYMRIFGEIEVVLEAKAQGPARGFVERDWPEDASHPVLYRKRVGAGEITYFTLGHRRGHYDMSPLVDYYPHVEKGAWEIEPYREILRRCLVWAKGGAIA